MYTLDDTVPAVYVEATYSMTNTTPNRNEAGGVRYFYYDGMTVPIELAATEIAVQLDGTDVEYEIVGDADGFGSLSVEFRRNLRYQQTATLFVSYRLPGNAARTETSFVRVNPAYASFPVFGYGDDGRTDLAVNVPPGWTVEYSGDDLSSQQLDDGRTQYTATSIADPLDFGVLFTARRDDQLSSTPLTVGAAEFEVRSWPDDPEWRDFAVRHITDGLPALELLTGTPWPEVRETDVIEASTPYLRGYAGFYYPDDDLIEVGEELDGHTMLHELAHAWFNHDNLGERWLSEGLADEISARAVARLGDPMPGPDDFPAAATEGVDPFPLNDWRSPTGLDEGDENYGYRTSFEVMRALFDEIGEARMTQLVEAVLDGDRAYQGPGTDAAEPGDEVIGWRQFLDLAEQLGGSTQLVDQYRELVVTASQAADLDDRAEALEVYTALAERGGTWQPPEAVRDRMARWVFASAIGQIERADQLLDLRDQLTETLSDVDLRPAPSTEADYERATDLDEVDRQLVDLIDAARRLVAAHDELELTLGDLGVDTPPVEQAQYNASADALAAATERLARQADDLSDAHARLHVVLDDAQLTVPPLATDAFVASPEEAIEEVESQLEAAEIVADAHLRRQAADSLLERVGRLGSDADAALETADAALAEGDTATAIEAATDATDALEEWDGRGRTRVLIAAIALTTVALLVVALLLTRRRRRRAAAEAIATAPDEPAGDDQPGDHELSDQASVASLDD